MVLSLSRVYEELDGSLCFFWYILIMCARWDGLLDEARDCGTRDGRKEENLRMTTDWLTAANFALYCHYSHTWFES